MSRAGLCFGLLAMLVWSAAAGTDKHTDDARVLSVWRVQTIAFKYNADANYYRCDWLIRRIQAILKVIGGRPDPLVAVRRCASTDEGFSEILIQVTSPIEAEPEVLQQLTIYDSRDQLIATVRKQHLPTAEELTRFWAQWTTVSFWRNRELKLSASDCQLLRQLADQVFPRLRIRTVQQQAACARPLESRLPNRFVVQALVEMPQQNQSDGLVQ